MDRRTVLKRAGVLGGPAVGVMGVAPTVLADDEDTSDSIVGAWIGSTNAGPPFPPFRALYMFARGGGMDTSSSIDLSPHSLSTPGYGAWARVAARVFTFTFDAFVFDEQGNPSGTVEARTTVTLNEASNAFSGPFKFVLIAPCGAVVFSGSGTHEAVRIRPKAV